MNALRRYGPPVTMGVIVAVLLAFLVAFFSRSPLTGLMVTRDQPWGVLTYPLASDGNGFGLLWLFLSLFIWFQFAQQLETRHTSLRFGLGMLVLSVVGGLALYAARFFAAGGTPALLGIGLPLAAMIVWWGMENRGARVMLWGVIPISGLWIAILTAILTFFAYGMAAPLQGLLALAPLALAWRYAVRGLPGPTAAVLANRPSRATREREDREFAEASRRKLKREEDERLRKLLGE